jgi:phospholipid-translocating ATPase
MISVYQGWPKTFHCRMVAHARLLFKGGAIMLLSLVLFENELINLIAISFTSLIFVELIMVGLSISTWSVTAVKELVLSFIC